jgi:YHS domain-containing protein
MNARNLLVLAAIAALPMLAGCQNDSAHAAPSPSAAAAGGTSSPAAGALKNGFDGMPAPGTKAVCPVMGDEFEVKADTVSSVYQGKTYVFCCPACKPKFDADPAKYLKS